MKPSYQVWKTEEISKKFLEGVRSAIPLAAEQIEILLRVIRLTQPQVNSFLDLGCGNGILGKSILQNYPQARGVFLDFSETMLSAAKNSLANRDYQIEFYQADFGKKDWLKTINNEKSFDVIVSGFAIHHQPDTRKQEIYAEIYDLLKPGGLFLNLEHIASKSAWGEKAFDELFVDSLYSFHQSQGVQKSREEIDKEYYTRADKVANILASVEIQCDWLREIGFIDVDCFMKLFEIALFGGLRPKLGE
ncbi:class I SAM-dependent methyltransferase [Oscillatoria salina]|uniref:class I SAM-dependent methyltransferase n=1 Tax=Oscillatoria salina TaxID=331517 RepID=UPI0013BDA7AF|nr:class I SAM-dependent methyltransferase [Oscillatoria salina]MBZ8181273.1 methyltransferase domain-containing protein [Oscillatoria salina IIICB1]NET86838.1 methyltransferase domain-containing protein [Kamptonema sp. SIO1D9]